MPELSISVVSHAQCYLVVNLLSDISRYANTDTSIEVILTLNIDEELPFEPAGYKFTIKVIRNRTPQGFSANHNQAFAQASGQFFCVINPDIRLEMNPFPALLACLQDSMIGVAAPLVFGESGSVEDSARRIPTPFKILCKALGGCRGSDYVVKNDMVFPDWVAGMFMVFRNEVFKKLCGFNERYFLYYEDVDLCTRLRLNGYEVALCPAAKVIHHAHRSSHRDSKYLKWHIASMLRFFLSLTFLRICWRRLTRQFL